ncbi:MAG TPA: aldehyde dehydrogenase family protein, partial [Polyangiaceae bacterium]|nr:aldehyde dehydrogenase family protein [Polyangiaceae bacterium]
MAIVQTVESDGRRRLRVASPATEQPIGDLAVTTGEEVRAAVARARKAQPGWEALGFEGRAAILRKALALLVERQETMIDVIVRETGRSRFETVMMEIFPACDSLGYYAKNAGRILGD